MTAKEKIRCLGELYSEDLLNELDYTLSWDKLAGRIPPKIGDGWYWKPEIENWEV